jgi:hypothetical protein
VDISSKELNLWIIIEACFKYGALQHHQNEGISIEGL